MTPYGSNTSQLKFDSLRAASLSESDNMVNSNSNFNKKYAEFPTKWQVLVYFHNPTCACSQRYNLDQNIAPLLQSILTSLFHPYLLTKSSLQSPLTLPSSIPQQFFTFLFLHKTISRIYTKNIFPTISTIQAVSRDHEAREYCGD